ncbi:MAG TPA: hypothetical protein VHT73_01475 [Thermodesulfobacteriota bacterium]|nr:hypothetical protein [Thermodesulfobacteriota bacterium]
MSFATRQAPSAVRSFAYQLSVLPILRSAPSAMRPVAFQPTKLPIFPTSCPTLRAPSVASIRHLNVNAMMCLLSHRSFMPVPVSW